MNKYILSIALLTITTTQFFAGEKRKFEEESTPTINNAKKLAVSTANGRSMLTGFDALLQAASLQAASTTSTSVIPKHKVILKPKTSRTKVILKSTTPLEIGSVPIEGKGALQQRLVKFFKNKFPESTNELSTTELWAVTDLLLQKNPDIKRTQAITQSQILNTLSTVHKKRSSKESPGQIPLPTSASNWPSSSALFRPTDEN